MCAQSISASEQDAPIKQRIIDCAGEIFADRGYRDSTVRDIASAAQVNLAGISYHFGGKQQLYIATVEAARHSRIGPSAFWNADTAAAPRQQLRGFIRMMLARLIGSQADWKSRLLAREMTSPSEFCSEQIADWYRPIFDGLMRIVEQILGESIAEPQRTRIGFSIVGQCLFYRVSSEAVKLFVRPDQQVDFELGPLADHIFQFTLAALQQLPRNHLPLGDRPPLEGPPREGPPGNGSLGESAR